MVTRLKCVKSNTDSDFKITSTPAPTHAHRLPIVGLHYRKFLDFPVKVGSSRRLRRSVHFPRYSAKQPSTHCFERVETTPSTHGANYMARPGRSEAIKWFQGPLMLTRLNLYSTITSSVEIYFYTHDMPPERGDAGGLARRATGEAAP